MSFSLDKTGPNSRDSNTAVVERSAMETQNSEVKIIFLVHLNRINPMSWTKTTVDAKLQRKLNSLKSKKQ